LWSPQRGERGCVEGGARHRAPSTRPAFTRPRSGTSPKVRGGSSRRRIVTRLDQLLATTPTLVMETIPGAWRAGQRTWPRFDRGRASAASGSFAPITLTAVRHNVHRMRGEWQARRSRASHCRRGRAAAFEWLSKSASWCSSGSSPCQRVGDLERTFRRELLHGIPTVKTQRVGVSGLTRRPVSTTTPASLFFGATCSVVATSVACSLARCDSVQREVEDVVSKALYA
jgi:hypothetical protein